ncbi:lipid-A-disaccharide synthase [Alcanivorax sp. JB21]|uniref:lipid-A-disaccharide synthase n=1 Tax=Alcanivorax limicola TaxID=2874102 RepID=UPI001CBE444D|nr:lipid-A-disaccharide synthase [Alcanivorax limicola]MBZ2188391.1 lipid-A-disaccharide synthase [Alcanivorax limicola]
MPKAPLFAIIAGEMSGDILGAGLMQALRQRYPDARFIGVCGPEMIAAGGETLFPMERLSVMGITEVLPRLRELFRLRRQLVARLLSERPVACITIDSPDFTLSVAKRLHRRGVRTVHYVSPSVWAWRQGRVKGIKASIDLMLTLLPFEARFYEEHDVPVAFVGHPLADMIPLEVDVAAARATLGLARDQRVLAVLPGSRGGEVRQLLPDFLAAVQQLRAANPALQVVIPAATGERHDEISAGLAQAGLAEVVTLVSGQSRTVMAAADVIMMASGTATLEGTLLKKPMVVGYRVGALTYFIARRLVNLENVSLPNLLAQRPCVPELLQDAMTPDALAAAVQHWLDNPDAVAALKAEFTRVHEQLRQGASERAATAVAALLGAEPDNRAQVPR